MPNSCLGQNLLVNHHGIAVSRNSCLSHAQILKHHGIAYVQEECFHTWENQMFAKIRLQLHSTVHVSGVEKYLPLRSADFFRFADSFRFAALGPSVASLCHPWFTTNNLSYRFPIFETTTCRTTSERRSKRRQKIRKALCPPACGTT